jgi:hypothetical protein
VTPFSHVEYVVYLLRRKEAVLPQVFQPGDSEHEAEAVHGVVVIHYKHTVVRVPEDTEVWVQCPESPKLVKVIR